jgi:hypothetical protein
MEVRCGGMLVFDSYLIFLRRVSIPFALCIVLTLNLRCARAALIPLNNQPCLTSSCPEHKLSAPILSSWSRISPTHDNSTCSQGYAECRTDTGFVDCCDESKVLLSTSVSAIFCDPKKKPFCFPFFLFVSRDAVYSGLEMFQL